MYYTSSRRLIQGKSPDFSRSLLSGGVGKRARGNEFPRALSGQVMRDNVSVLRGTETQSFEAIHSYNRILTLELHPGNTYSLYIWLKSVNGDSTDVIRSTSSLVVSVKRICPISRYPPSLKLYLPKTASYILPSLSSIDSIFSPA